MVTLANSARSQRRADELRTKADTLRMFLDAGSPQVIIFLSVVTIGVRLSLGRWSWADAVVLAISVSLVGLVEWCIHLFLLHAEPTSWRMRVLKTGHGHREHHLDPPHVGWLLLRGVDAALFAVLIAGLTAAWTLPLAWLLGVSVDAPSMAAVFSTGLVFANLSLGHYEWTHLLVHTNYRPKSRYYARLARNHRLHHFRNERYWLGVTSNMGDRLLHTLPADKSAVPLSPTARHLDGESA